MIMFLFIIINFIVFSLPAAAMEHHKEGHSASTHHTGHSGVDLLIEVAGVAEHAVEGEVKKHHAAQHSKEEKEHSVAPHKPIERASGSSGLLEKLIHHHDAPKPTTHTHTHPQPLEAEHPLQALPQPSKARTQSPTRPTSPLSSLVANVPNALEQAAGNIPATVAETLATVEPEIKTAAETAVAIKLLQDYKVELTFGLTLASVGLIWAFEKGYIPTGTLPKIISYGTPAGLTALTAYLHNQKAKSTRQSKPTTQAARDTLATSKTPGATKSICLIQ